MLKKLLILPILGSILGLGAFASATDYVSQGEISVGNCSLDGSSRVRVRSFRSSYFCLEISPSSVVSSAEGISYNTYNDNSIICNSTTSDSMSDWFIDFNSSISSVSCVKSSSPITYGSSSDDYDSPDSSLGIPEIPASFTSGLTSLVNNFGGTIANWLPTIILVALGIYAIFALFRVVRNYARSSFRG